MDHSQEGGTSHDTIRSRGEVQANAYRECDAIAD